MTPEEAADLLGVDPSADEAAVQAAFRIRARAAHPDGQGAMAPDLGTLQRARDLLIQPATHEPLPPAAATARPGAPRQPPPPRPAPPRPAPRGSGSAGQIGCLVALAATAGMFLLVAAVAVIAVVGILTTRGADDRPTRPECVVVLPDDVAEVPCDAAEAQRLVTRRPGVRTCPTGQNTLVVGSVTWCLEPVEG